MWGIVWRQNFPGKHVTASDSNSSTPKMTEYWVSQGRHYCEICKCWFGDNRASIDFHERGKRHQDSVQRHLKEARFKTAEKEKEKAETEKMLAAIERAATNAYYRDLEVQVGLAPSQDAVTRPQRKAAPQKPQQEIISQTTPSMKASSATASIPPPPPSGPPPSLWQQLASPEGYTYYYNSQTGVSQWEPPPEFQQQILNQYTNQKLGATQTSAVTTPQPDTTTPTSIGESTSSASSSSSVGEAGQKRTAEEASVDQPDTYQPPKRAAGAYGGWTTVAVRPRELEKKKDEEEESGSGDGKKEEASEDEKRRGIKFEEKRLPTSSEEETVGSFKGFGFKKRTGGLQKKRPQIRQRTSDI